MLTTINSVKEIFSLWQANSYNREIQEIAADKSTEKSSCLISR